ncbi:type III secretion system export apparatus subunit SctT [Marinomonas mediterranea]|jgi:type III secretion protein SpaR/YscT/HrcT|uniref:Type III secretion protein SpaR/YscT/HrcT n=1 Tax=Marinomonas mediterranea (strain ATCC 700492 / JCM 21426 / NBRC 103028 / MMB-1) TaxID=717774 RepID=F2JTC6_MARM1|nr:type III secretion system export apparatus subunit SctT [Marinomonas mediterranea]ADZ90344.1 type III secretion protein SpaR/YscT/HrcT [Marinomonas mediterranea MMB-1]WCN08401.1 EscT/YscT/HrcT family type III secretion system export apparatus protein [Marinomonas mediterranea]WCN12456.1 EscT/YscT/HrcT family type III secretion system export apparatus protein [Marinomonas mediterranea]WCN16528.1 EscT/YscT/HrcT family type III secretion system export apparatus protein [Marinomonas mediterranea
MVFEAIDVLPDWVLSISLGMARLYPCLLLIPLFSFKELKGMLRYALVVVLALMVAPGIKEALPHDHSWFTLLTLYLKETALGMLLGIILAIPFWLFESVGGLFDNQRGALMGGQLNPSLGQDFTPLGFLFKQTLIVLMITTGSFEAMLQVIWDSYVIWPPTVWYPTPTPEGFEIYLSLLRDAFTDLILYAAPLVALLLFVEFGVSVLSLYSPQLQAFVLAMPIKCLAGLGFLIFYIPTLFYLSEERNQSLLDLKHLLALLFDTP